MLLRLRRAAVAGVVVSSHFRLSWVGIKKSGSPKGPHAKNNAHLDLLPEVRFLVHLHTLSQSSDSENFLSNTLFAASLTSSESIYHLEKCADS